MAIPESVINVMLNGCPVKKQSKKEEEKKVKTISDLYKQKPGSVTCNHCDYFFIPQDTHRFNCPHCYKNYIQCPKCKKYIENK
jgi:phage terminase large subunit GpA-like protein